MKAGAPAHVLAFEDVQGARELFGERFGNLKVIETQLGVQVHARGSELRISGPEESTQSAVKLLTQLYELVRDGISLVPSDVTHAARMLQYSPDLRLSDFFNDSILMSARKKAVVPRSLGQKEYIEAIRRFDIVFGIGPAGTGKTYLAMAMAVGALMRKDVRRIVLTRPAVEAGERLGFLPGDLAEKVNPYLRPLYDALHDMMDYEKVNRLIEKRVIEVAPLAFMRGRTLNEAFVILDEAQNTTSEQMRMFLTRLGIGSKAVITGDITQSDLPQGRQSGLTEAKDILGRLARIGFVELTRRDVVRHPLVQEVIEAYERRDAEAREVSSAMAEEKSVAERAGQA